MRLALAAAVLSTVALACSSSDDSAEDCNMVGTYAVTSTVETGDCPDGAETTYTISANGSAYFLEVPGIQGGCSLEPIGQCKAQGKCDVVVKDAADPNNSVGGVSFAWTFSAGGFTGSNTMSLPPAKSLPSGCNGRYSISATRL